MTVSVQVVQPVDVPEEDLAALGVLKLDPSEAERWIVQSPYTERRHLLDLETLDYENAVLAKALRSLRAIRRDYAIIPYTEAFNWPEVLEEVKRLNRESGKTFKETSFYIVAFRSQVKGDTDMGDLFQLDKDAHAEAIASGGFLRYWYGTPDSEMRNLATCIWRTREDALEGGTGPAHRKAANATRNMYSFWKIDQHRLTIRDNVDDWEITAW